MKHVCILVVIVATAFAQSPQVGMAEGRFMIPTIAVHDQDVLEVPENNQDYVIQRQRDQKFEGNHPLLGGEEKNQPIIGGDENMPIIGRQEFNPFEYREDNFHGPRPRPEQQRPEHPRPEHPRPGHRRPGPGPQPGMGNQNLRDQRISNRIEGEWERIQFVPNPSPMPNHEEWERHVEGNHMEKSRYHRKLRCMLIGTAVVFTFVGICLAKCCRKCHKKRKQRVRAMIMRSRTSESISEEIKHEERKLDQLKAEYAQKLAEEERLRRQQQAQNQAYQMHMRSRQVPQQRVYYNQPYIVQEAYYNPRTQIPLGRPINESNNSSFATEYPQL